MAPRDHQRLLVAVLFSFIVFMFVDCKGSEKNLQPSSAPRKAPGLKSSSPASSISFPPSASGANPPSHPPSEAPKAPNAEPPSEAEAEAFDAQLSLDWTSDSTNVDPSVQKICDSTDYPSLCLATVVPLLDGNSDVLSVLEVAMKATNKFATFAVEVLKRFAESPALPTKVANIINDCEESFDSVLYNYERALSALDARDIGTMNTMLSASITDIGDCDDAIAKTSFASSVSGYSDKLTNMTSNCLAIVSLIK